MFSNAKVGDRVWSRHGWGTIKIIDKVDVELPINVLFDVGNYWYTINGKQFKTDIQPSIFWDEIKFEIPPKPKRKIKKEGWVNIYKSNFVSDLYLTENAAINGRSRSCGWSKCITTKLEWEEEEE